LTSIVADGVAVKRILPSWFSLTRNRSASPSGVSERVALSPTERIASSVSFSVSIMPKQP